MDTSKLVKGSILSETSFYTVNEVSGEMVTVTTDNGQKVNIGKEYLRDICSSADQFDKVEKLTKTALADIFINSPRVALTVAFFKQDKPKTKTAIKKEKVAMVEKFQNAKVSELAGLVDEFVANPITDVIPGELRVMKGRHYGKVDDLGRVSFVDMEQDRGSNPEYDARLRQVDPRTIQYVIVGSTKYELKK